MIEQLYPASSWNDIYLDNTLGDYADALIIFVILLLAFYIASKIFTKYIISATEKTKTQIDDIIINIIKSSHPPIYIFFAFYIALYTLSLSTLIGHILFAVLMIAIVWQVMHVMQLLIDELVRKKFSEDDENKHIEAATNLFSSLLKLGLWIIAILLILSNIGINVTSLIAGIGIGGIAIAFTVKGILEDLFSSFSIYFDKPFTIGDTIDVDGDKGIVKKIGIKTTRLKSLSTGEEIVFANSDLTKKKIHNFRRMQKRRVTFKLGVTYDTDTSSLKKISQAIEDIISAEEYAEYGRTHMREFGDSAIIFSTLYHITSRNYDTYLDTHERILFAIREVFEKEEIDFAYPTQTIHLEKN